MTNFPSEALPTGAQTYQLVASTRLWLMSSRTSQKNCFLPEGDARTRAQAKALLAPPARPKGLIARVILGRDVKRAACAQSRTERLRPPATRVAADGRGSLWRLDVAAFAGKPPRSGSLRSAAESWLLGVSTMMEALRRQSVERRRGYHGGQIRP